MPKPLTDVLEQLNPQQIEIVENELEVVLRKRVAGDAVEFGCYKGKTSVKLGYKLKGTDKILYLYDSFEGLPEKSPLDISPAGIQFKFGELRASKKQVIHEFKRANLKKPVIHKAWFSDLAPSKLPDTICFAFLDGDYFQSIKDSLRLCWPRLSPGSVVVVDDYSNAALPGVRRALDAWLKVHPAKKWREQAGLAIFEVS